MARQMIMARGGPQSMDRHDRVAYFLSRWFAYLDVLGSLSGNKNDQPLSSFYWSSENASADEDFQIDCLMGFTMRCVGSLARIAELAKQCEAQRIDEDGNIREDWVPEPRVVEQAVRIRAQLEEGLSDRMVYKGCNHRSLNSSENEGAWDATEIYATNEMFHWAGLIHLFRRVLGKPAEDPEVQYAVREIVRLLYKVRRGSTAEACLLFPMFAAGCDARDERQREKIMERLRCVEGFGMTQVSIYCFFENESDEVTNSSLGPQSPIPHAEGLGYGEAVGGPGVGRVLRLKRMLLLLHTNIYLPSFPVPRLFFCFLSIYRH